MGNIKATVIMQTPFTYPLKSDEVIITKIFFINCLPDADVGLFNRCYEDITTNILNHTDYKNRYERIDCNSAARFLNALDKIFDEVNQYKLCHAVKTNNLMQAVLPFIQIEAHGSKDGIQMVNGETVSAEIFYEKILKINLASENNTILLSNTCFGMFHIINSKGLKKTLEKGYSFTTPVYAAVAPENKINSQDIEENLIILYKNLIKHSENINALKEYSEVVNMKIYFCGWIWEKLIKDKISTRYPYKIHKEERLTDFVNNTPILQHLSLTQTRQELKKLHLKELQVIFNLTEKEFLIRKKSTFTLDDIIRELDEENQKSI